MIWLEDTKPFSPIGFPDLLRKPEAIPKKRAPTIPYYTNKHKNWIIKAHKFRRFAQRVSDHIDPVARHLLA
jgi:hypothetical protein